MFKIILIIILIAVTIFFTPFLFARLLWNASNDEHRSIWWIIKAYFGKEVDYD